MTFLKMLLMGKKKVNIKSYHKIKNIIQKFLKKGEIPNFAVPQFPEISVNKLWPEVK